MSPMNKQSNYSSSNCGEDVAPQVNVLASCYIVGTAAQLKGLHYCTTGVTGAEQSSATPPPENQLRARADRRSGSFSPHQQSADDSSNQSNNNNGKAGFEVDAWMEVWDYVGGASFRAFLASNDGEGEKSLFVFFDLEGVMGRDLKKALMALIELADGPLGCGNIVTCMDRRMPVDEAVELTKSLQWVGFEMTTLDHWANDVDVTSDQWLFMGMEL
ncbi:uncharacterized protein LMH87_009155 [Akanthomyces muscarius]|uniref:Ornithine decarboxylase antizyme n=1 Tax=Akanthomyces muscarius TaxID=2231603 RepID=A0A9W8QHQ0_AKAMU|nr:uncharacterized protein LMH87_009155 [Akanthomyces muscarius]KAJ4158639.1 hypothetical protein LMH87_009155 [Akanthomyces muscarius]